MFVHLNCHSHYSFLTGASRIRDLVEAARRMGCPALALTDTNSLHGAVEFYREAQRAGIRPIFGAEIEPSPDRPFQGGGRATLLARNLKGFGEVCRVLSDRHLRQDFAPAARLAACGPDVFILSPDPALLSHLRRTRGPEGLYVELVRHGRPGSDWRLAAFAKQHRLPMVASQRAFCATPEDWEAHRLLSAIRTNRTVSTLPPGALAPREAWLKPPAEMARLFRDLPQALWSTSRIADECRVELPLGRTHLPPFRLPAGETGDSLLRRLARQGVGRLYRSGARRAAVHRLESELAVIGDLGLASYFLIVWDIVREATGRGIPSVGRGSAANSLVCRALGITQVDPLRYDLYFERFLSRERTDLPDIDIDFPWNRRDEMIDYVFDTYGHDHVALISTHVHFRSRSLVREVGKALGVPVSEIDAFTRGLPHFSDLADMETVRRTVPECRDLPLDDEPYRSILALSRRIEGFPRHVSIHCGGIVVSPHPITDHIPLQKTPKGFAVTQYDMYPVEDMGLLKIDLLAQKGLAVLSDTLDDVRAHYGAVDFERIDPVSDPETRALVKAGRTIGCFYIESPGMRNLLRKLGVETFEMLTAASSIIRPGVSDSGMMKAFIDRHNGREAVHFLHPKLEPILRETFGVMIYQEDVIKVANAIAGMSLGEAEGLRKCMSKKRDWEAMSNYRERFLAGARVNGVAAEVAEEIWRQVESFAGYAFCKAHSASFALLSYQTAWLKAHYPAEFMAAVLSNRGGFYDTAAYVEEARRLGLEILPPDVNRSEARFTASSTRTGRAACGGQPLRGPRPGEKNKLPGLQAISSAGVARAVRVGLMQVRNLSHAAIESILEARRAGPFVTLEDFWSRVNIDACEAETLIRCGACDAFGPSRPFLLWRLKGLGRDRRAGGGMLPGWRAAAPAVIPPLPQYSLREKLWAELECLDITVSSHLLALYGVAEPGGPAPLLTAADAARLGKRWHPSVLPVIAARHLDRFAGRMVTLAGWLITAKRTRTVKHEWMKFMTLEDPTACFEVTIFPGVYRRYGTLLHDRGPYIVRGRVERDGACCTLTALWLDRLSPDLH